MSAFTHEDLLSHLVELIDYRVKEISYVDEGANLMPFLLTKKLKRDEVKKEAFAALLETKVKNAGRVVEVLKRAEVPEEDQAAVQNVLRVLTGLKTNKTLSNKTLGEALHAAELADMTGTSTETEDKVKGAFDFIANKIAIKIEKMMGDDEEEHEAKKAKEEEDHEAKKAKEEEDHEAKKGLFGEDEDEDKPGTGADREKADGDEDEDDEERTSSEAEEVNKRHRGGKHMKLSEIPVNKAGELDIAVLKKAGIDAGTITLVKSLWGQNKSLTSNLDKLNEKLTTMEDLQIDKRFQAEANEFEVLKFEGLKDVLKKIGTSVSDEEYVKVKSLLKVAADALKPAGQRDFEVLGGSTGGSEPANPREFYNVCKSKAVAQFKEDEPVVALQKFWKTEEGRQAYSQYDHMVTNR